MKANLRFLRVAAALASAAFVLGACAVGDGGYVRPAAALAVPQSGEPRAQDTESRKEANRAPVTPVPAEFRTPEQATQHAADPKTPTGAIIIKPPIKVIPPDPQPSEPTR